ncbi:hypothetical protein TNCV_2010631 [Trichonephila clavipes]|nr:hypothetical protein TNCV_2010631 [Trichonephila clavipes]
MVLAFIKFMISPNLGNGLWKNMWNARIRKLWSMGCPLPSSSIYKASRPSFSATCLVNKFILLSCQRVSSPGQANRTLNCPNSQRWQRSPSDGESCRTHLHEFRSTNVFIWYTSL